MGKGNALKFYVGGLLLMVACIAPFGEWKANRVMSGQDIALSSFFDASPLALVGVLLTLLVLIAIWQRLPAMGWLSRGLSWLVTGLPLAFTILISAAPEILDLAPLATGRMAPKMGYWSLIFAVVVLCQGSRRTTKIKLVLALGLLVGGMALGLTDHFSLYLEFLNERQRLLEAVGRHFALSVTAVALAGPMGIYLGYQAYKNARIRLAVEGAINFFQVVPTLTLLTLLMLPLTLVSNRWPFLETLGIRGVGFAPSVIALTLYALLPVTYNAIAGFRQVSGDVLESAVGMGLSRSQVYFKVHLPLAWPAILSGLRTAMTQTIGNAILAGLIGGGGLGAIIFLGLSQAALDLVLLGAIPIILMALFLDALGGGAHEAVK